MTDKTESDEGLEQLRKQHREDGETLEDHPDLLAAARRAHTLLVQIEVDAGEYYRETAWLDNAIAAEESRRSPLPGGEGLYVPSGRGSRSDEKETVAAHWPDKPDKDLIDILGRPNFTCIQLAQILRRHGYEIASKAEHEQAAVIFWLLGLWFRHGSQWHEYAGHQIEAWRGGTAPVDEVEEQGRSSSASGATPDSDSPHPQKEAL